MKIEQIQFALFPHTIVLDKTVAVWARTFDVDPENLQQLAPGGAQASANIDGVNFLLQVQAGRIDLYAQPAPPQELSIDPPFLEDWETTCGKLLNAAKKAAVGLRLQRVAVVLTSFSLQSSSEQAIMELQRLVPGLPAPEGTSDVFYQISQNDSVRDKVRDGRIIRILRWFTAQKTNVFIDFSGGQPVQNTAVPIIGRYVDCATDPLIGIDSGQIDQLLAEIAADAIAIQHSEH